MTDLALVADGQNHKIDGQYKRVAKELSADGDILLKEGKLVIPYGSDGDLRKRIIKAAHKGHPGVSWTKARL